jgi:carbonic anhydrase
MKGYISLLGFASLLLLQLPILKALTPQESLIELREGNRRYLHHSLLCPQEKLQQIMSKQTPFAVILSCSDSRVIPEVIFDQSVGSLFVIRVAGNVAAEVEFETIDYGVLNLKASLIVVLGHENCGAVTAVLAGQTQGIPKIATLIAQALGKEKGTLAQAIKANIDYTVKHLKGRLEFLDVLAANRLKIIGAYYHFGTGKIDFFEQE